MKLQKGCLLIAKPSILGDTSFNRAIVLLANHDATGSVDFILNKPLDYGLKDLVSITDSEFTIYNGGPVEQNNLYFIHSIPDLIEDSIEISDGIYWGGNFDTVISLINESRITEADIQFFLGYSGWDINQLLSELESESWLVANNLYKETILSKNHSSFWREKMIELGGEYSLWSNAPEHPSYN